jgi:hypothetical protein
MPSSKISLKLLVDAGLVKPGRNALSLQYKKKRITADLLENGSIVWNGHIFWTVSSFSMYAKRITNAQVKTDNGWDHVCHRGVPLATIRDRYRGGGRVEHRESPFDWSQAESELRRVKEMLNDGVIDVENAKILRAKIVENLS